MPSKSNTEIPTDVDSKTNICDDTDKSLKEIKELTGDEVQLPTNLSSIVDELRLVKTDYITPLSDIAPLSKLSNSSSREYLKNVINSNDALAGHEMCVDGNFGENWVKRRNSMKALKIINHFLPRFNEHCKSITESTADQDREEIKKTANNFLEICAQVCSDSNNKAFSVIDGQSAISKATEKFRTLLEPLGILAAEDELRYLRGENDIGLRLFPELKQYVEQLEDSQDKINEVLEFISKLDHNATNDDVEAAKEKLPELNTHFNSVNSENPDNHILSSGRLTNVQDLVKKVHCRIAEYYDRAEAIKRDCISLLWIGDCSLSELADQTKVDSNSKQNVSEIVDRIKDLSDFCKSIVSEVGTDLVYQDLAEIKVYEDEDPASHSIKPAKLPVLSGAISSSALFSGLALFISAIVITSIPATAVMAPLVIGVLAAATIVSSVGIASLAAFVTQSRIYVKNDHHNRTILSGPEKDTAIKEQLENDLESPQCVKDFALHKTNPLEIAKAMNDDNSAVSKNIALIHSDASSLKSIETPDSSLGSDVSAQNATPQVGDLILFD